MSDSPHVRPHHLRFRLRRGLCDSPITSQSSSANIPPSPMRHKGHRRQRAKPKRSKRSMKPLSSSPSHRHHRCHRHQHDSQAARNRQSRRQRGQGKRRRSTEWSGKSSRPAKKRRTGPPKARQASSSGIQAMGDGSPVCAHAPTCHTRAPPLWEHLRGWGRRGLGKGRALQRRDATARYAPPRGTARPPKPPDRSASPHVRPRVMTLTTKAGTGTGTGAAGCGTARLIAQACRCGPVRLRSSTRRTCQWSSRTPRRTV